MNPNTIKPSIYLVGQAVLLFALLLLLGKLNLNFRTDSYSYLEAARLGSLQEMFSFYRTIGYPLFIKLVALVSPQFSILPTLQFIAQVIAVLFFSYALRQYGFSNKLAVIAASPLLYIRGFIENVSTLGAESLIVPVAVLTIGFLILTAAHPRKILYWLGLTISLFATYQIRPAFLFILPLTPILGIILAVIHSRKWQWKPLYIRYLIGLLLVVLLPYFLFCGARYLTVGHFGLVSFGGQNIAGLTSQMLSADMVNRLPVDVRPLAESIIERRSLHAKYGISDCARRSSWGPPVKFDRWAGCYGYYPWGLNYPAAKAVYGDNPVQIDKGLSTLSVAIIKEKPKVYATWVAKAFFAGIGQLLRSDYLVLLFSGLIVVWGLRTALVGNFSTNTIENKPREQQDLSMEISMISAIGIGFFLAGLLLVILVEPPIGRYVTAVSVFVPSNLAVALYNSITTRK